MTVKLWTNVPQQFLNNSAGLLSGGKLFTYAAGSSTKTTTYQDSAGVTPHTNPIVLDTNGRLPAEVWLTSGVSYKFVLTSSTDTDPPTSALQTWDNLAGINDTTVTLDQWVAGPTPTYVSATSFTLVGDQTSTFMVGRRLKTTNSGGTIYSSIVSSAYTTLTTITVVNDSGTLDSGLSAVSYGILSATNTALPPYDGVVNLTSVSGTNTVTASATKTTAPLVAGQVFSFVPANSNTGATTLNVNSLGAKNIFLNGGALVGYELRKNCPVQVYYDGTQFNIIAGAHGGDGVPIGTETNRYFATAPNGHLLCDGTAVSRTTYADLFAVLSTTWGSGDGATTFNLPHSASRVSVGSGTGTVAESVTDANVSVANDTFTVASNNTKWVTGMAVVLTTTTTLPTGLSLATTYYVIRDSSTTIKFASSLANAQNGTAINITAVFGSGTHTLTGTLTTRTVGEIGGEESHATSSTEQLAHTHGVTEYATNVNNAQNVSLGGAATLYANTQTITSDSTGGNAAANVMNPYVVVYKCVKY